MTFAEHQADLSSKHVLVVEDEALVRWLLAETLRNAGINVFEAANADQALDYVLNAPQIDLVFTDVQMPGSMDGLAFAERLQTEVPLLPVIITSGTADPQSARAFGRFVPKPYQPADVTAIVFETLGMVSSVSEKRV
jgi:CheY-like chemotaxis protein